MIYTHNNHEIVLDKDRGTVYTDDMLVFKGYSHTAIIMFIKQTDNDPIVVERFRNRLEQYNKQRDRAKDM
ncbi:hypothetical protein MelnitzEXVC044M_136 [Methylophilales phage Melnitz EXVC044M]|nr:hypothetical protein Melnitz1EXVC043M_135 [Methylophilales phage Melnitz-1 EXVC043M]QZI94642.1 hypothetical protein Melnitz2EXVC040M_136 [Methylophilales phage Melnitz-2 EXVC040M]QZI94864.1 hypothetical protein MelnitzEXVC044M_136 [Methylophilales phage Melnitz EXVC044M]QZI95085.1 hypothetical protein Melnitz3EXVC039M_136 [Methylophilales phage Melnitz-3 EXVC039M]